MPDLSRRRALIGLPSGGLAAVPPPPADLRAAVDAQAAERPALPRATAPEGEGVATPTPAERRAPDLSR